METPTADFMRVAVALSGAVWSEEIGQHAATMLSLMERVPVTELGHDALFMALARAGALDDLRENFRRIQLVFDGEAPEPAFRAPGVERVRREGRVLTVLSSAGAEPILDEARALSPVSVDVVPVTLKEIFLETVTRED